MLQAHNLYTKALRCNPDLVLHFRRIHTQIASEHHGRTLTAVTVDLGGDRKVSQEDARPILSLVPPIRNTLFEPSQSRPQWYTSLNSREDALRFFHQPWLVPHEYVQTGPVGDILAFTRLVSRVRKLGVQLPPDKILYGLRLAIDEPTAMKKYLEMFINIPEKELHSIKHMLRATLQFVFERIVSYRSLKSSISTTAQRKAAQFLEIITGWQNRKNQVVGGEREPSIYHLMLACGNPVVLQSHECTPWSQYIQLLSRFGGLNAVYGEWLHYKAYTSARSESESLNLARNEAIRSLVKLGDPKRAWEIAYEAEEPARDIEGETWQELLKYPDGVKQWIPEMNGPAISMLTNEVANLERHLGIRWKGAEDGYHILTPKSILKQA